MTHSIRWPNSIRGVQCRPITRGSLGEATVRPFDTVIAFRAIGLLGTSQCNCGAANCHLACTPPCDQSGRCIDQASRGLDAPSSGAYADPLTPMATDAPNRIHPPPGGASPRVSVPCRSSSVKEIAGNCRNRLSLALVTGPRATLRRAVRGFRRATHGCNRFYATPTQGVGRFSRRFLCSVT